MNKISYLLTGILIGLFFDHFFNKPQVQIIKERIVREDQTEVQNIKQKFKNSKSAQLKPIENTEQVPLQQTKVINSFSDTEKNGTALGVQKNSRKKLELTITEDLVNRLEKNWYELPHQIQLMNESRGWRVQYIEPNSLFAETGLRAGDFISQQSIENLKIANSENNYLSDRVIRLLNHVQ